MSEDATAMLIDPSTHYDRAYWNRAKPYRVVLPSGRIEERSYVGPALHWDGFGPIAKALVDACNVEAGSTWLDLGCGAGSFISFLHPLRIDAFGVDISSWAINSGEVPGVEGFIRQADILGDAPFLPSGLDSVDVCSALDLVEHIYAEDQPKLWAAFVRTGAKLLVLDIGAAHIPRDVWEHPKGVDVPLEREWQAVSGHVMVQTIDYWRGWARALGWTADEAAMMRFETWRASTPGYDQLVAWGRKNLLILRRA